MPVIVEGLTVLGREPLLRPALEAAGGRARLGVEAECSDGELLALRLLWGVHPDWTLQALAAQGLALARPDGEPGDLAVVWQGDGPAFWWPWLEFARLPVPGDYHPMLAARLAGSSGLDVAKPRGWTWRRSVTLRAGYIPLGLADRPLRHLRRDPTEDIYVDRWTGEEPFLRREHEPVRVAVEGAHGRGEVTAELVTRDEEVEVGLMFRDSLAPGTGMLFRFERPARHGFWMKNTLLPLDILFVDAGGRVVNVAERVPPLTAARRRSAGPVVEVLEVPAGWCEAHGVGAGARLTCR